MKKGPAGRALENKFDELRETVPLQVKDFPNKLKRQVQARALLENKTLKQVTIELYEGYLKGKDSM